MPTFILGVGAPKSGTTWVYEYLRKYPNVDMGIMKEYHVWDCKFNPYDLFNEHEINLAIRETTEEFQIRNPIRNNMRNIHGWYEDYFKNLIKGNITITGDITPSYLALNANNFSIIKNRLETAGFDIKVVLLARDPIQRCWSAIRYQHASIEDKLEIFKRRHKSRVYQVRTKYDYTLTELEKVFNKENIYVGIYEEMFTDDNIRKISDFCGVGFNPSFKNEVINSGLKFDNIVDDQSARECYSFYKPTYDYFNHRFPQTKTLWAHYS